MGQPLSVQRLKDSIAQVKNLRCDEDCLTFAVRTNVLQLDGTLAHTIPLYDAAHPELAAHVRCEATPTH